VTAKPFLSRATVRLVLVLLAVWGALLSWTHLTLDGRIDACLDGAGRWGYEQGKCERDRSAP
jgi:hypothetical protein